MVIFNIAPRRWGKTHHCVDAFLYLYSKGMHPAMLTENSRYQEEIIHNILERNVDIYDGWNKSIFTDIDRIRARKTKYLIIDEYSKFDDCDKQKIYQLKDSLDILIWTSPIDEYNKLHITNIRDNKKKGMLVATNSLFYDLITEPKTKVFLYSYRNKGVVNWLSPISGVEEVFDFSIDIEQLYFVLNSSGIVYRP